MSKVACWTADRTHLSCHFAIRHQVFVEEQRVMVFTDVDEWDRLPQTRHVLAASGDDMAGTVRLYAMDNAGTWKGDRLAVLPAYRASMVGARLVRFAVATAAAAGGKMMHATVQVANTRFFERLGWECTGPVALHYGLPHQPMSIDLLDAKPAQARQPTNPRLRLPISPSDESPLLTGV